MGWDSMHPEFNFPLNIGRMFAHVWAGEQGVGAISAHSDMGDLPRIILLWASSLILPASFIRYFYIFSCLILGPLGMYFFLKYLFQRQKESLWIPVSAFLGGLYYLLNLGTLQNFYVPLEMFTAAFAGVPWLFLTGIKALRSMTRSNLVMFALVVVLISPMAYAATQAYAIYLGMFLFLFSLSLFSSGKKLKLKRLLILGIVTLLLNIYWILPNIYAIAQQSLTISNANINRLFSQESFLRNADYGRFDDVLIQKNFLFNWRNFDFASNTFKDLLGVWNTHLSATSVMVGGYFLAALAVLGLLWALVKREKIGVAFLLPLALCLFFLLTINPPFGGIYSYFYSRFPIFGEAFRTPFTKFSVLFELIMAFYFGYFCFILLTLETKHLKKLWVFLKSVFVVLATGLLVYFSWPAFQGEMIGRNVRVKFPEEYFALFDWFENNPEGRVALVPMISKYGWEYRNWDLSAGSQGYEGSGFLTYGIRNPILYRDFDRWNSANEDFYTQSAFALYANDSQAFISTLKKYNVKYLLLDESITNAGASDGVSKIAEIKNIAEKTGWSEVANFGFLSVYDTGINSEILQTPETYSKINVDVSYSPVDPVYQKNGDYIEGGNLTYPFISLDKRSGLEIKKEKETLVFINSISNISLSLTATESAAVDLSVNQGFDTAFNCDLRKSGDVSKEIVPDGVLYKAFLGGVSCDYISFPHLKYSEGYVLRIAGKNTAGRGLKIYLFDSKTQLPYMEEILPAGEFDETYFVYPREIEGEGYILNLETRSFGRIPSENLLIEVEAIPVDYSYLENYKIVPQDPERIRNNLKILDVQKMGSLIYKIKVEGEGLFTLDQGFEKGWIAMQLPINNLKLTILDNVKVNSWANGWLVDSSSCSQLEIGNCELLIIYWPQALEWVGLFVGATTLLVLSLTRTKKGIY